MPRYSIIVPAYDGEKSIDATIDSVLANNGDFEIVICDDCSTDCTLEKIRGWSLKDKRIRCLKNDCNLGVLSTVSKLIKESRGDYVIKLDCDDTLDADFMSSLDKAFSEKESDIVELSMKTVTPKSLGGVNRIRSWVEEYSYDAVDESGCLPVFFSPQNYQRCYITSKAFRRELLTAVPAPDFHSPLDDVFYGMKAFCLARSYRKIPQVGYIYSFGTGSWSKPKTSITMEKFTSVLNMRWQEWSHNRDFLLKRNLLDKWKNHLLGFCDLGSLINEASYLESVNERQSALKMIQEKFQVFMLPKDFNQNQAR